MFDYLYEWTKDIAFYLLLVTAALYASPGAEYRKYIRFFTGLILVLLVFSPVFRLFGADSPVKNFYRSREYEERMKEIEESAVLPDGAKAEELLKNMEDALAEEFPGDAGEGLAEELPGDAEEDFPEEIPGDTEEGLAEELPEGTEDEPAGKAESAGNREKDPGGGAGIAGNIRGKGRIEVEEIRIE